MSDELDDERQRITALVTELAETVGPFDDQRMSSPVLTGWVLVAEWEDLAGDADACSITRMTSAGMRSSQRVGLLHEALFGMD